MTEQNTPTLHARLSPSAAHRWMRCPGSLTLEAESPRTSSTYADEGTAAHELAARTLKTDHKLTRIFLRQELTPGWNATEEMCEYIQTYINSVLNFQQGGTLLVEQKVDFSDIVGVPDSFGTADVIIMSADGEELQIHDLKYGRGVVVNAEKNEQLGIYALAAADQYSMLGYDFKRIKLVIHQPRLDAVSEWDCEMSTLQQFGANVKGSGKLAMLALQFKDSWRNNPEQVSSYLVPGEKQCRFCNAKATCPALEREIAEAITGEVTVDEFSPLSKDSAASEISVETTVMVPSYDGERLGRLMSKIDLIEAWCTAVRARVESELLQGHAVTGYKLVEGRKGARAWADEKAAEEALKAMRYKKEEMYNLKLISPAQAEKTIGKENPRRWTKLQELITQNGGKPSVAPVSDKRAPLQLGVKETEFTAVGDE